MTEQNLDSKVRILLVEDQEEIRNVLRMQLEILSDYKVEDFSDPVHAIPHLEKHPKQYGLIVSDYQMMHENGVELARQAYEINPQIPFVILSGDATALRKENPVLPENIKMIFDKPTSMDTLRQVLELYKEP